MEDKSKSTTVTFRLISYGILIISRPRNVEKISYRLSVNLTNALNSCCPDAIRPLVQLKPGLDKPNWIGCSASDKTCRANKAVLLKAACEQCMFHVWLRGFIYKL